MILDLSAFVDETLDIHLADGAMLRLPKPSQRLVIEIMKLATIDENTPEDQQEAALNKLTRDIINSNLQGLQFSEESVAAISGGVKLEIIDGYTKFIKKIQANPTSSRPGCREEKGLRAAIRSFFRALKK